MSILDQILLYIQAFLPIFMVGILIYAARQYEDKDSAFLATPFLILGIKELIQAFVAIRLNLPSMEYFYTKDSIPPALATGTMTHLLAYSMDIVALVIFISAIMRFLEYGVKARTFYLITHLGLVAAVIILQVTKSALPLVTSIQIAYFVILLIAFIILYFLF